MSNMSVSDLPFSDIRELVRETGDTDLLKKLDQFLGAAVVIGAAVSGQVGILALLGPKNELVKIGKKVVSKLGGRKDEDFVERHRRMRAAYHLVVFTAFFEVTDDVLTPLRRSMKLPAVEKMALAKKLAASGETVSDTEEATGNQSSDLHRAVEMPHPVEGLEAKKVQLQQFYSDLTHGLERFIETVQPSISKEERARIGAQLAELPAKAVERQEAQYFALASEFPYFSTWLAIHESEVGKERLAQMQDSVREAVESTRRTQRRLDVGLAGFGRAVEHLPALIRQEKARHVTTGLAKEYRREVNERIIDDRIQSSDGRGGLVYPKKADAFVPQAFKVLRAPNSDMRTLHLEDEDVWESVPVGEDIGDFMMSYLSSPYSVETPLVILGHPGSGKSLLALMLSAHLATPNFNPVRVVLRDVVVEREIQNQVEDQICRDTGLKTNWAEFSSETAEAPPVIIFDGFDELLQASGRVHANYLEKVQEFQRREANQGRPVRAIVTSRITLIDKAIVPRGSTLVRLLEFDEARQTEWIGIWNRHNESYFKQTGVRPFELPDHKAVRELASQPLLLMMLAIFDSDSNPLRGQRQLDRTLLYDNLLRRFIARELAKDKEREAFRALEKEKQGQEIEADMRRLGVAAMSMFSRRTLHILSNQLDVDIEFFKLGGSTPDGFGYRPLTQAELLLGSFFFVHESRSRTELGDPVSEEDVKSGPAAFEFLHNTFGEFLTADFILTTVANEAHSLATMASRPELHGDYERKLAGGLPDEWYVSLMYTPLYTRPVILEMIREWSGHLLARRKLSHEEFLGSLDVLVRAQLRSLLEGNEPPPLMTKEGKAPYESLPLLGHYAVYSLNLLLVRAVIGSDVFEFDESDIPLHEGGTRPWDQLTHLWRSWLSTDDLSSLGAIVRSERRKAVVEVRTAKQFGVRGLRRTQGRLDTIWSTANALGDAATSSIAGLHLYDSSVSGPVSLDVLSAEANSEQIDVALEVALRRVRAEGWASVSPDRSLASLLAKHAADAVRLVRCTRSHGELLSMLTLDDAPIELRWSAREGLRRPIVDALSTLPESFLIAHVRFCSLLEPAWFTDLASMLSSSLFVPLAQRCPRMTAVVVTLAASLPSSDMSRNITRCVKALLDKPDTDVHPDVLLSVLLYADKIRSRYLQAASMDRLTALSPERVLGEASPDRLRWMIGFMERAPSRAALTGWLRTTRKVPRGLSSDLTLELARLRIGTRPPPEHVFLNRGTVVPWGVGINRYETAAWVRLLTQDPELAPAFLRRPLRPDLARMPTDWLQASHKHVLTFGYLEDLPIGVLPALMELGERLPEKALRNELNAILANI